MKYKYVPVFISYDKVADKMNHLVAQGYEYDKEAIVAIRMKKVSKTSDKQYKFIFDKNLAGSFISFKFIICLDLLKGLRVLIRYILIPRRN